jgi:uncharacterized membrane protein SpoIIM required for sporulation
VNKRQFVRDRRASWRRFDALMRRFAGVSLRKTDPAEVAEFSRLFRELSNDLAVVKSRAWGASLASYLNDLVARGHNVFYSAPPGNVRHFVHFVAIEFPRLFRANAAYFLVAAFLFFVPGAISWAVVQNNPAMASRIIPNDNLDMMDEMYSGRSGAPEEDPSGPSETSDKEESEDETVAEGLGAFGDQRAMMMGFYVWNNAGIALECFARGILLGVGTIWALLYNGIFIGAVGGFVISKGHSERFLSFVVGHGAFELTAIAVAGGAGLMLGNAILHQGQRTLKESLLTRGLDAIKIAVGAALMLFVAAIIEAFWSPAPLPAQLKYVVGAALWLLVFLYLALAGRER